MRTVTWIFLRPGTNPAKWGFSLLSGLLMACSLTAAPVFLDDQFELPKGFRIYRAATAELSGGSYDLVFDGQGRLLVGDGNAVRRLKDADGDGVFDSFEVIVSGLGWRGPQGLLVYGERLYAVGGDGVQLYEGYDSASGLVHKGRIGQPFRTGGDHDAHTILRGHDGFLYFVSGDGGGTRDRLHITESNSPVLFERAASVFRISPDGKKWECLSAGGRNPPNLGQHYLGDLFSFDSDMEWHVGLPWWRPVRLNHWLIGGDLGWQEVGAYPPYYIDTIPGVLDAGRGSPTWGVFYEHSQFPARYRDSFLVCDYRWKRESSDQYSTSGRLVAFFLERTGAGWNATMEILARPKPEARDADGKPISFALVDIEVAPDGSIFLSDHNQGIWRIVHGRAGDFSKMPAAGSGLDALLELPQPASEWSRLAEEQLKAGGVSGEALRKVALDRRRDLRKRLRAIRLLAPDYEYLPNEFLWALNADLIPEIRGQAMWLFSLRGKVTDINFLQMALNSDKDALVRRRAAEGLTRFGAIPEALFMRETLVGGLLKAMGDRDRLVRYAAMAALAQLPTHEWFSEAAKSDHPQVVMRALVAAKMRRNLPPVEQIRSVIESLLRDTRLTGEGADLSAMAAAQRIENQLDLLRILGLFREQFSTAETEAVTRWLLRTFPASHPDIGFEQVRLLGEYRVNAAFPRLLASLENETNGVRQFHIAQALAKLSGGWNAAEEARALEWFLAQQTGWFAEFRDKGVEFPQYWATVLADFARHHPAALLNARDRIDLSSLLGSAYIELVATSPNGVEHLVAMHDARDQRSEIKVKIARRLARETQASGSRHFDLVLAAFREGEDRELLRASAAFLARSPPVRPQVVELVSERAIRLLDRERSLFRPLNDLLVAMSGTNAAPAIPGDRIEPALREQISAWWKAWFAGRFNRSIGLPEPEAAARADGEVHRAILARRSGDAVRGGQLYERLQCHTCHGGGVNPGREGAIFGPDLAGVARRLSRQELADALVYPSKQVPDRFKAYELTLKEGATSTGFITEQNEVTVTFVERDQVRQIPRGKIQALTPQKSSLMPEQMLNRLSDQELADLLAFLEK